MSAAEKERGWLPPRAAGEERQPPTPEEPPPAPPRPAAATDQLPPHGPPPGGSPPAPAYGHHPPPPGYPPPSFQPPTYAPGPYGAPPHPAVDEPGNGDAVASLVLGICSLAFLLVSAGLSTIVSLICGVLGIIFGRRGKRNVESGETRKHRGLAQAGFVTGIVGTALSLLATAFWIAIAVAAESDPDVDQDLQRGFDQSSRALPFAPVTVAVARALLG